MNNNLTIAEQYYRGWESSDKSLLNLSPDLKFTSPDSNYSNSEDFITACWQYSGIKMNNKIFLSGGDHVCVKYDFSMPDGSVKPCVEWLTFKKGMISEILVFYNK